MAALRVFRWVIVTIVSRMMQLSQLHFVASHEYCQFEAFNASCSASNQVILMDEARYGRLRLGRCVTHDYGFIGCSTNVLDLMDRACSGRRRCVLPIPTLRDLVHPCPKDLTCYLEASYRCITVVTRQQMLPCNKTIQLTSSLPTVYAPGIIVGPDIWSAPGSAIDPSNPTPFTSSCPVLFSARQGQQLQVSLYSFGTQQDPTSFEFAQSTRSFPGTSATGASDIASLASRDAPVTCPLSVHVVEEIDSHDVTSQYIATDLCRQPRQRERHLYTTNGTTAHVFINQLQHSQARSHIGMLNRRWNFVLKLEAIGCPDVLAPSNAWLERSPERLVVRCNHSFETWYLTCKGNSWIGSFTNCTDGLLVAIVVGVLLGIIVGAFLLTTMFLFRRRRTSIATTKSHPSMMIATSHHPHCNRISPPAPLTIEAIYACPVHGAEATAAEGLSTDIYVTSGLNRSRSHRHRHSATCRYHSTRGPPAEFVTSAGNRVSPASIMRLMDSKSSLPPANSDDAGQVFCTVNSRHTSSSPGLLFQRHHNLQQQQRDKCRLTPQSERHLLKRPSPHVDLVDGLSSRQDEVVTTTPPSSEEQNGSTQSPKTSSIVLD